MMYSSSLLAQLVEMGLADNTDALAQMLAQKLSSEQHGDFDKWATALAALPKITPSDIDLTQAAITVGQQADVDASQYTSLSDLLHTFHPWRKGPFKLFDIFIDTEWRSDLKWDRLLPHIAPLSGRRVLDIGCGSGYHCWRMRGAGADFVLGVDPTLMFVMQYFVLQHFIQDWRVAVLPLGIDELSAVKPCFDTVFSMGLLYHRRDPLAHLQQLKRYLAKDGELVLETLVIEPQHGDVLVPEGRYAQMRNVWSIPSVATLSQWLAQAGYRHIRCVDVTPTTSEEQRVTPWMQFQSLADFLDPDDSSKTIEGYPAPLRAMMLANSG